MLSSLLNGASLSDWFVQILYRIPAVLIAISLHEYAHALMAHLLGDNTAKMYGRLTPNPAAHFDIVGALCMLFVGFGWAKPVPFDYRNLKKPKRDTALIAFAGPLMNFIVACSFAVCGFNRFLFTCKNSFKRQTAWHNFAAYYPYLLAKLRLNGI